MAKTKTATKTSAASKKASSKTSKSKAAPQRSSSRAKAGDKDVTIDRRRKPRHQAETASTPEVEAAAPKLERRKKVNRRRQIDPTTCERDYSDAEVEFMNALDDYKRKSGRMFPTCSEVLEVIRGLGYVQLSPAELASRGATQDSVEAQAEAAASEALEESEGLRVMDKEFADA